VTGQDSPSWKEKTLNRFWSRIKCSFYCSGLRGGGDRGGEVPRPYWRLNLKFWVCSLHQHPLFQMKCPSYWSSDSLSRAWIGPLAG
jgi:hypothetical protein